MIADVAPDAVIAQEEIFGPVLAVIKVNGFEEGLEVANNTEYGLTGAIYTADRGRWTLRGASFTSAICTSTASARERWWGRIRLADST